MRHSRRILPRGMSFYQALVAGYTGRIVHENYLRWLRTLPCDTCGAPPPSQASHLNSIKGQGTKSPDLLAIPECDTCHRQYEAGGHSHRERRLSRAAIYLLQAWWEGRLVWREKA